MIFRAGKPRALQALRWLPLIALAPLAGCGAVADAAGGAGDRPAAAPPSRTALIAAGCNGCHGPDGTGSGAMPALAGSDAQELASTLERWRQRAEPNARDHVMVRFARSLRADDVEALAQHYAALPGRPQP